MGIYSHHSPRSYQQMIVFAKWNVLSTWWPHWRNKPFLEAGPMTSSRLPTQSEYKCMFSCSLSLNVKKGFIFIYFNFRSSVSILWLPMLTFYKIFKYTNMGVSVSISLLSAFSLALYLVWLFCLILIACFLLFSH